MQFLNGGDLVKKYAKTAIEMYMSVVNFGYVWLVNVT